jgi:hypothetical protein
MSASRKPTPLETLHELALLLARSDVTAADAIARVGETEPGSSEAPGLPIVLRSSLPGIRSAKLGRYRETGLPFFLMCDFAAGSEPRLADLVGAFGRYRNSPGGHDMPVPVRFEPIARGPAWTVTPIAYLPPGASPTDDARVTSVSLRRDPL